MNARGHTFTLTAALLVCSTALVAWGDHSTKAARTPPALRDEARVRNADRRLTAADSLIGLCRESSRESPADLLEQEARRLNSIGRHDAALPLFERSLALQVDRWGSDHLRTVRPLLGLASVLNKQGSFKASKELYLRSLGILESTLDPSDPLTVEASNGLSVCLLNLGDFRGAERILRERLAATTSARGAETADAGGLMLHLAEVLAMTGQHSESTRLFRQAAVLIEHAYGPDHTRTATALSGLAHTYRRRATAIEAGNLYRRCIRIVEKKHGDRHPDLIHYRCRLGMCLLTQRGKLAAGLKLIKQGIATAADIYGANSYQVALEERHLGLVLLGQKRWADASSVLQKSLATLERFFGAEHPYLSKCLKGLAEAGYNQGRLDEAYEYACRAVATHEPIAARDAGELVHLLNLKAAIEMDLQRWTAAVGTARRAAEISLSLQEKEYQTFSTREAVLSAFQPWNLVRILMMAVNASPERSDSSYAAIFPLVARTHGQVLDWLAERQRLMKVFADSTRVEQVRHEFAIAARRVADLAADTPEADRKALLQERNRTRHALDAAERKLTAASERLQATIESKQRTRRPTGAALAEAMEPGMTLIHFLHFSEWLAPRFEGPPCRRPRYGAFRLTKQHGDAWDLQFVDLGLKAEVDSLVQDYRRCIDAARIGRRPSVPEEARYRSVARRLYDVLWAPLVAAGDGPLPTPVAADSNAMILLVPVSRLHLLDFNTLLAPSGELVIERWKLFRLSSACDLLRLPSDKPIGSGLLAVGNPAGSAPVPGASAADVDSVRRAVLPPCTESYRKPRPLPGAEFEAKAIAELFAAAANESVTVLLGTAGTEEAIKDLLPGKRIVHLATHGFYCEENPGGDRLLTLQLADPLLMSGLLLTPSTEEQDGLLTAQEIVDLDLRELEWVVLSACSSGLGQIYWGEGVFGLRRAFEIAGARTVLMALWRIDDAVMSDLMTRIYRHRLAGRSTVDAVRKAQLERLNDHRRLVNRIHPSLWGGIVAEGDWR